MITLNKKHCLVFTIIVFFIFAKIANAEVIFSEIAWKGTSTGSTHEWLELSGSAGKNISGWKINDATNKLYIIIPGNTTISSTGFYVIKRTTSDITPFDLSVSFSGGLLDTGEKLILTNSDGVEQQTINFIDGWPDSSMTSSNTMQWNGSDWITASPTPKSATVGIVNTDTLNTSNPNVTSNSPTPTTPILKVPENPKITTKIIANKISVANVPFEIDHQTIGLKKEKIILGKFVWNFGDGFSKSSNTSELFQYVYQYPGDYVLTLSYYDSSFNIKPDAGDRIVIKVIPSGINISSVGTASDAYIELENNSNYEIALMSWRVVGSVHSFTIPEGMIILPNKKLKLSPRITGFDINDLSSITVLNSSGEVFATYPNIKPTPIKYSSNKNSYQVLSDFVPADNAKIENNPSIINLNDMGASVANADSKNNVTTNTYAWLGLIGIIIVGIASVLIIRKKHEEEMEYPEYVGDKLLGPKDMKIIE